jgi:hypothetical protein
MKLMFRPRALFISTKTASKKSNTVLLPSIYSSVKIRPKICPVAEIFIGSFWVMQPNFRPAGNNDL